MLRNEERDLIFLQESLEKVLSKYKNTLLSNDNLEKLKASIFEEAFQFTNRLRKNLITIVNQGTIDNWDYILEIKDLVSYPIFIYCHIRDGHLDICLRVWG